MAWAAYGNVPGKPGCKLDIRSSAGSGTEIDFESSGFDGVLRIGGEIPFARLPPEGGVGL